MAHVLVIANETAASHALLDALSHRDAADDRFTVIAPVNEPARGYVVYEDTRRASAGRRLERTLKSLREAGFAAQGFVVETGPVQAAKDALVQLEPPVDEIVVSTHPVERSGWLRRNVVERIQKAAGEIPVEHIEVDLDEEKGGEANVLVVANQTLVGDPLLDKIRARAEQGQASFLILCPQSDPTAAEHPEAERRLRRALTILRGEGLDVHGQIAHPDPFTAASQAVQDERVDEIIVSTFPGENRSNWLRGDLVNRLRKSTGLPVDHIEIEVEPEAVTT